MRLKDARPLFHKTSVNSQPLTFGPYNKTFVLGLSDRSSSPYAIARPKDVRPQFQPFGHLRPFGSTFVLIRSSFALFYRSAFRFVRTFVLIFNRSVIMFCVSERSVLFWVSERGRPGANSKLWTDYDLPPVNYSHHPYSPTTPIILTPSPPLSSSSDSVITFQHSLPPTKNPKIIIFIHHSPLTTLHQLRHPPTVTTSTDHQKPPNNLTPKEGEGGGWKQWHGGWIRGSSVSLARGEEKAVTPGPSVVAGVPVVVGVFRASRRRCHGGQFIV
ncbi:hypothetical protein LR48_Vigan460s000800 [Vigna angularis]|uniref:Uncharacterized protein n=1 Tax=Phaseolus angularis TaxID=3914 RepID=A0A0L9TB15_PHAAN|nr:hypothetical protein LR48_Vigan460s000800 [Vigna angularis]